MSSSKKTTAEEVEKTLTSEGEVAEASEKKTKDKKASDSKKSKEKKDKASKKKDSAKKSDSSEDKDENSRASVKTRVSEFFKKADSTLKEWHLTLDRLFAALIAAFMSSYILQMLVNGRFYELKNYYASINFPVFWITALIVFSVSCLITYKKKIPTLIPRILLVTTVILSCLLAGNMPQADVYFNIGIAVVDFIIITWLVKDDKLGIDAFKISDKTCFVTAIVLFIATAGVYGFITSMRYLGFMNSTFDFGIFAQMFEYMANTGLPLTTVERSELMSHFGVHFSPFFYLLLPGYFIFRSPLYLVYAQAAFVALGVIPTYLICKKLGFSSKMTLAFEFIYAFYPCLFNGCFYDFHENKFLTVVILFLFYFILCDNTLMITIFSVALLSIKEDSAIYLLAIALFIIISRKKYLLGSLMIVFTLAYFVCAQNIISELGKDGVMMWRLSDYFVNEEQSFFSVLKSIFFDAGFLLKQMFTAEKFPFLVWMLLPCMFTPFLGKKIAPLVLLLPMLPINLMQSWQYQFNIDFQYTYGIAALIIIATLITVNKLSPERKKLVVVMSLCTCAVMSVALSWIKVNHNFSYFKATQANYASMEKLLSEIPSDATVTSYHRIMPHLYNIKEIYTYPDTRRASTQTDYYVIDTRDQQNAAAMKSVMGDNYTLKGTAGCIEVYKKNS